MLNLKSIYRITHDLFEKKQYVELKFYVVFFDFIVLVLRIFIKYDTMPQSLIQAQKNIAVKSFLDLPIR